MTKVTPYPHKTIPIILINGQELGSFEHSSHVNAIHMDKEAVNLNAHRKNHQEKFCEFNKTGEIPRRACYHITCLYRKNNTKNSVSKIRTNRNLESQERIGLNLNESLSSEKRIHYENAQRRENMYLAILRNDDIDFSWVKLFLYTFGIVFLGLLSTFPMTLAPGHDLVKCPQYWYEILYYLTLSIIGISILTCVLSGYYLNVKYTFKPKNILVITLIAVVLAYFIVVTSHYIWTSILMYQYPIPFLGHALKGIMGPTVFILIYFNFPMEWRLDEEFRKRLKYLSCICVIAISASIAFRVIIDAISHYQTIVGFTSIAMRETILWIRCMLVQNTSDADPVSAITIMNYYTNVAYTMILCNLLATKLSDIACWILIGADFCINILKCFRLFWTIKRNPARIRTQVDYLQDLIICELIEFQAPLSYILTFICTYFGHNGHLFGNVLNGYWTFIATEDINQKLYIWTLYFLADLSSFIIIALSLWYAYKINVFKVLLDLQQEFGPVFIVVLGALLNHVS